MFAAPAGTNVDPSEDYIRVASRVGDRFPYSVPFAFSEQRTPDFPVRYRVFYCAACEEGMERALKLTK